MRRQKRLLLLVLGLVLSHTGKGYGQSHTSEDVISKDLRVRLGTRYRSTRMDCSHFVNYIYRRAHLPYRYASSRELYEGSDGFARVLHPLPGDLIVWRGHVGIVVDPNETKFVSVLRSGVKVDDYLSRYWKTRGTPRFLRYVGDSMVAQSSGHSLSQRTVRGSSD